MQVRSGGVSRKFARSLGALAALSAVSAVTSRAVAQGVTAVSALAPSRGVAELPRALPRVPRELAGRPCTRTLKERVDLQDALDRAKGGEVICLTPGASYVGSFTLRARKDTGWVVVRTGIADDQVATPGQRIRPSKSGPLAKLIAPPRGESVSALETESRARGWYLVLLEITTDSATRRGPTALIALGGKEDATPADAPRDIVLDRIYAHGWPDQVLRRCVALNSASTAIVDSWLDDCHEKGSDSQAIAGWNGAGPYLIENNTLAGAGENVMFGGSDPRFAGMVPSDIVLRRNHIITPVEWKGRWSRKNLLETKNVRRLLVEENVLEGAWGDGQVGFGIVIKSANQTGGCRWCSSSDVIVRRNLMRKVGAGISVSGQGGDRGNIDSLTRRVEITENYIDSVNVLPYNGVGQFWMFLTGVRNLYVAQNTSVSPENGRVQSSLTFGSPGKPSAIDLVFERNVMSRGRYTVSGCGGLKRLSECLPGSRVSGNVIAGNVSFGGGGGGGGGRKGGGKGGDQLPPGFSTAASAAHAIGRSGMARSEIDRITNGVVVPR
jgi:hypothetical protein